MGEISSTPPNLFSYFPHEIDKGRADAKVSTKLHYLVNEKCSKMISHDNISDILTLNLSIFSFSVYFWYWST